MEASLPSSSSGAHLHPGLVGLQPLHGLGVLGVEAVHHRLVLGRLALQLLQTRPHLALLVPVLLAGLVELEGGEWRSLASLFDILWPCWTHVCRLPRWNPTEIVKVCILFFV